MAFVILYPVKTVVRLTPLFFCLLLMTYAAEGQVTPEAQGAQLWLQAHAAGSPLDTKTDSLVQRLSAGLQTGIRFQTWGLFLHLEMHRSIGYDRVQPDIELIQVGPGVEYLWGGHTLRSSVSIGATSLTRAAGEEVAGHRGWYIDLRPVSVRFPVASGVVEFFPIYIDISVPTHDSELEMYSNFIGISYEWGHGD